MGNLERAVTRSRSAVQRASQTLADAAIRRCHMLWLDAGASASAEQLAELVWLQASCRDPQIAEARAVIAGRGGRHADLRAALAICGSVLANRGGSTDPAWESLAVREAQLGGRLERLANPTVAAAPSGESAPARPITAFPASSLTPRGTPTSPIRPRREPPTAGAARAGHTA